MRRFSRIYGIAQSKNMLVEWSINVSRNLNDWEISEYEDMLKTLASQQVKPSTDQIIWNLEEKEVFTVSSYYRFLVNGAAEGFQNFPCKQI